MSKSFTSKSIENQNIYNLSHAQISQLVQDLIRNDILIKSRNQKQSTFRSESNYFQNSNFMDSDYQDFEYRKKTSRDKFAKKYEYMYDSKRYDVLLHRGLEYIDSKELQEMLGQEYNECKGYSYIKKR